MYVRPRHSTETCHLEDSRFPLLNQIFLKWLVTELTCEFRQSNAHFCHCHCVVFIKLSLFNACGFHIWMGDGCFTGVKIWKAKAELFQVAKISCCSVPLEPIRQVHFHPASSFKFPALAEMTDLQLKHWPNSHNYRYILYFCAAALRDEGRSFPYENTDQHLEVHVQKLVLAH